VKFSDTETQTYTILTETEREALQSEGADLEGGISLGESEWRCAAATTSCTQYRAVAIVPGKGGDVRGAAGGRPPARERAPSGLRPPPQRCGEPVVELQRRRSRGAAAATAAPSSGGEEREQEQSAVELGAHLRGGRM
jgi:hypothetical protein